MVNIKYILVILVILFSEFSNSQLYEVKEPPLQGFSISGFYRFYAQHRLMTNPYAIDIVDGEPVYLDGREILAGDDTQLPELTLNISGRPNSTTSFGTDLVIWNQNNGNFDYYRNLLLGVNLYGNFQAGGASVAIRAGGIHWHNMTAFTMRSFFGYNRFSLFERNPWDPQFKELSRRYSEYLERGEITQDSRWANQAVQGFLMDIGQLPFGLSMNVLYGKTQNAGAALLELTNDPNENTSENFIKFYSNTVPNYVYGGQLIKKFDKNTISINTFNRKTYLDQLATLPLVNNILTTEFDLNLISGLNINGEIGAGRYHDLDPGEMVSLKLDFDKKLTKIPFELHYYRISPNVKNNNSEFVNTSVNDLQSAATGGQVLIGSNGVLQQSGSAMLGIGQMANNRQGLNINSEMKITKNLSLAVGTGMAKEIVNKNSELTFGYAANGLTMARFWRWTFPSNVGPYNRKTVLFRTVTQSVQLTDLSDQGEVVNDKYFNNIEAQLKYKFMLFDRPFYSFYLGAYNSAQTSFSPTTVFTEDAYVRFYSHQLEGYYSITDDFILALYAGWERVIGNYDTQVNIDTQRPLNQENIGIGIGFDFMIAKNTGLYFRHRWFSFEDRSFPLENFGGHESTVELKLYF